MFENSARSIFPNIIDQSSCRILTTHAKTRPILQDDWSVRLGENGPDKVLKHLAVILATHEFSAMPKSETEKTVDILGLIITTSKHGNKTMSHLQLFAIIGNNL